MLREREYIRDKLKQEGFPLEAIIHIKFHQKEMLRKRERKYIWASPNRKDFHWKPKRNQTMILPDSQK